MIIYLVTVDSNGSPYNQLAFTTKKEAKKYVKKQNKKKQRRQFRLRRNRSLRKGGGIKMPLGLVFMFILFLTISIFGIGVFLCCLIAFITQGAYWWIPTLLALPPTLTMIIFAVQFYREEI